MIAPMKRFALICVAAQGDKTLETLRDLGCAHIDLSGAASADFAGARERLDAAGRALRVMERAAKEMPGANDPSRRFDGVRGGDFAAEVLAADAERTALAEQLAALERTIRQYAPFGDFDPALAAELGAELAKARAGSQAKSEPGGFARRLSSDGTTDFWVFAHSALPEDFERVAPPPRRLSEMTAEADGLREKIAALTAALAAGNQRAGAIADTLPALKDKVDFAAARDVLAQQGEIAWIEGWIPEDAVPRLRAQAVTGAWGIMLRDPEPGETPPTLVRPPKLFRPVAALFEGLGIAPAYNETDVSVPFMCYFSLFFAMLVGDGGYGAIILAMTICGWLKTRPEGGAHRPRAVRSWLTLLTVFSVATIGWGAISNTWFGAALPFAREWASVKWLGDETYSNMMFLCFTIGVSHLMIARIWSGCCMLNDRRCLSQFGWAGIVLFMYMVTNSIVGIFSGIPQWAYWTFGVSLALVFLFTLKGNELKTRGVELGMLPLNVMSALGDIISYVRLFAVGLASVKVAQNFNDMALGLDMPLWLKIVPMILILLIGHTINFVMAGLSILVHAVRLNTLEFSNHKGISWAGYAFSPFRKH